MCFIAKAAIRSPPLLLPECHLKRLGFRAIASADPVGDIQPFELMAQILDLHHHSK